MKFLFIDGEFTALKQQTTLISIGLVGEGNEELYLSFSDYNRDFVTDWVRENVLSHIDESKSISQPEGFKIISKWLEDYSQGEPVLLVSYGKDFDQVTFFELWKHSYENYKDFHLKVALPKCLSHAMNLDLMTIFALCGIDAMEVRENVDLDEGARHNALDDAKHVKECFYKNMDLLNFPNMDKRLLKAIDRVKNL